MKIPKSSFVEIRRVYELECNHSHQDGIHCICDEGWISSGLHRDNPLKFNWCDSRVSDPYNNSGAPKKLSKGLEVFLIVASILNTHSTTVL